jgi:hypothetical protein
VPDVHPRPTFFASWTGQLKVDRSNSQKLSKIIFREGVRNKVIVDEPFFTMFSSSSCDQDDDFFIFYFLLLSHQDIIIGSSLSQASLKHFLPLVEKRRRDCCIPRCLLLRPDESPFRRLYLSGNEQALITFTGLDHRAFSYILHQFTPLYHRYTPYSTGGKFTILHNAGSLGGRPWSLDPAGCLALVLGYTQTRGSLLANCG